MPTEGDIAMRKRKLELAVAGLFSFALVGLTVAVTTLASSPNARPEIVETLEPIVVFPDFASIADIDLDNTQFFDFLQDYVRYENGLISELRHQLLAHAEIVNSGIALTERERNWVLELAISYGADSQTPPDRALTNELLKRVDVIPASLVLAQAANASAWGTSRFALEANNIFGQWCFEEGCGIILNRRIEGATHEVKSFDTLEAAIEGSYLNINTHHLY